MCDLWSLRLCAGPLTRLAMSCDQVNSDLERWEQARMWLPCPHSGDITPRQRVDIMRKTPGVWHLDWIVSGVCVSTGVRAHSWRCMCLAVDLCVCVQGRVLACWDVCTDVHVCSVLHSVTAKENYTRLKPDVKFAAQWEENNFKWSCDHKYNSLGLEDFYYSIV